MGFFIVLLSSLIYNEIIICNFCDLDKNTKKGLEERQKQELVSLKETENEIQSGNHPLKENDNDTDSDNDE